MTMTAMHVVRQDSKFIARAGAKVLGTFDTELEAQAAVLRARADSRGLTGEPEDQERDNEADGDEEANENELRALNGEPLGRTKPQKGTGYGTENAQETGDDGDGDADGDTGGDEDGDEDGDPDADGDTDHDEPGSGLGRGVLILGRVRKTHKDLYDKMSPHAIVGAYKASRKKAQEELDAPEKITHNQVMSHMTGCEY